MSQFCFRFSWNSIQNTPLSGFPCQNWWIHRSHSPRGTQILITKSGFHRSIVYKYLPLVVFPLCSKRLCPLFLQQKLLQLLPFSSHPNPYHLGWVQKNGPRLLVSQCFLVTFEIVQFKDTDLCDVSPLDYIDLLLHSNLLLPKTKPSCPSQSVCLSLFGAPITTKQSSS